MPSLIDRIASTSNVPMFMSIARCTFRYASALSLGLLINALVFTTLWRVASPTFEPEAVVATRIEFTRLRPPADAPSHRASEKSKAELIAVPAAPKLELTVAQTEINTLPPTIPNIEIPAADVRPVFYDVSSAVGYESDSIAMLRIPPSYPRPAKLARIQGYVTMEVAISPEGDVTDVSIVEAVPARMFDIAAMDAMKRWKFRPKVVNGVAVSQRAHQTIEFRIEG